MLKHTEGKVLEGQAVEIDGQSFKNCTFRRCRLIYGGGDFSFGEKVFLEECAYKFRGPAAATIQYLLFLGWVHPDRVELLGRILGSKPS